MEPKSLTRHALPEWLGAHHAVLLPSPLLEAEGGVGVRVQALQRAAKLGLREQAGRPV
jgi:hypothetical protein